MSQSDPHDPKGGDPAKGSRSICMEGGVSHSGLIAVDPLLGITGKPLTRIANRKLDWVLGQARTCELG